MITFDALPLDKYSSLHKISLLSLLGIRLKRSPQLKIAFNFSLHPTPKNFNSLITFSVRDSNTPPNHRTSDLCIKNFTRWRLHLAKYDSFNDYIQKKLNRRLQKKYEETQKMFFDYGATISFIEEDWSAYAERVYELYLKVAQKHGARLYNLDFFRSISTRKEYQLMCLWYNNSLFGALVMIDEEPIMHSMLCCLDYEHSKWTRAYSQMHYQIIRLAIESKKYTLVDIGLTADKAKAMMGYQPILSCMDVSSQNYIIKGILRIFARLFTVTITEEAKLAFNFRFSGLLRRPRFKRTWQQE